MPGVQSASATVAARRLQSRRQNGRPLSETVERVRTDHHPERDGKSLWPASESIVPRCRQVSDVRQNLRLEALPPTPLKTVPASHLRQKRKNTPVSRFEEVRNKFAGFRFWRTVHHGREPTQCTVPSADWTMICTKPSPLRSAMAGSERLAGPCHS